MLKLGAFFRSWTEILLQSSTKGNESTQFDVLESIRTVSVEMRVVLGGNSASIPAGSKLTLNRVSVDRGFFFFLTNLLLRINSIGFK
jgi:hypothetical protein